MENIFMLAAIREAKKARELGEIPVGAVIVKDGSIIVRAHNLRQTRRDATLHAEICAIRKACAKLHDWRLDDCDLYVTLEPCAMCGGAIISARMKNVYFGAYDPEYGAAGGKIDLFAKSYFGAKTALWGGIMQEECEALLNDFFSSIRKG